MKKITKSQAPQQTSSLLKYGPANTHDLYKAIGILLMIVDHIGLYLLPNEEWFRVIGRGAAPFFYALVGYTGKVHCSTKFLIYAFILSATMLLFGPVFWVNILFTFVVAEYVIRFFPAQGTSHGAKLGMFIGLVMIHTFVFPYVEYGTTGILIAVTMNWRANKCDYGPIWLSAALAVHFIWQILAFDLRQSHDFLWTIFAMWGISWLFFRLYSLSTLDFPKYLEWPIMVLSRYSLDIYFFHVIGLQVLSLAMAYAAQ